MKNTAAPWTQATLFFMAMAFLESAVVVYLRALYYPDGFHFPLRSMTQVVLTTEAWREVATLVMLWTVAALIARSPLERFAWFCFGFGVWDLFYYIWLKVLLGWPSHCAEPDLLFLLPVPWVGPVWAPCVVSIGLIILAVILVRRRALDPLWRPGTRTWILLSGAVVLFLLSFMLDPLMQGLGLDPFGPLSTEHGGEMSHAVATYLPGPFPWWWFLGGAVLGALGLWSAWTSDR